MSDRERGRALVAVIAVSFVVVSLLVALLTSALGPTRLARALFRTLLTAGVCWSMYSGRTWARWLCVVLATVAGGFSLFAVVTLGFDGLALRGGLMLGGLALFYLAAAGVLAFSPSVSEFFREALPRVVPGGTDAS